MASLSYNYYLGILLAVATPVLSFFCIREATKQNSERLFIFRPATMIVIILLAIVAPYPASVYFKGAIICGMLVALMGDSLMMLPGTPFVVGIVTFSIMALLYLFGFAYEASLQIPSPVVVLIILYAIFYYRAISSFLGEYWFPSIVFLVLLSLMTWQALQVFVQTWAMWSAFGLLSTVLLSTSASIFGLHYFRGRMKGDRLLLTLSYHAGQWLLALSVWGDGLNPFA